MESLPPQRTKKSGKLDSLKYRLFGF
jgi:hypothetical protein